MQTVLKGSSTEVVISPETPIAMIGERINPTGCKAFSAELRNGDLSRIARDIIIADSASINPEKQRLRDQNPTKRCQNGQ